MPAFPNKTVALSLFTGVAGYSTATKAPSLQALIASTAVARAAAAFTLPATAATTASTENSSSSSSSSSGGGGGGDAQSNGAQSKLEVAGAAMQSCLMWNIIYHPAQAGPFVQVSLLHAGAAPRGCSMGLAPRGLKVESQIFIIRR